MLIYDREGPELIRGRIWLTVLVTFFTFGVINLFVPNNDLIIAGQVMRVAASAVVVFVYWPEAWSALRARVPERTDYLIVGIVFSFLSNMLQSLIGAVGRMGGLPKWYLSNEFIAPTLLLSIIAAVLHVSAPDAVRNQVPRRNRLAMGFAFGAAVLVMTALGVTQPDIGPILEKAKPYISGTASTGNEARPL